MPTPDDYANNQPGANWRNFNPPPTTPGVFTVASPTGARPDPTRTTESSTRNGNPQATQVAQAPTPSGYTPEEIAGAKARGMLRSDGLPSFPPGTVKFNSQGVPYNPARVGPPSSDPADPSLPGGTPPHPGEYNFPEPEPAAKPLPNLGHWTPDQAAPWMHVKPIAPQQVPDRPPDTHVGTRPAYHPRPGEAGYTPPIHQPGQPYSFSEQLGFALQAGFTGPAAYTAAALGMAESKGNAGIVHYNDGGKGFNSYGLMQINGSNDAVLRQAGINGAAAAVDPLTSYKAAYVLSKGGTDFSPWTTFRDGSYKQFLDGNARPEASSTLVVGPRQDYRPPPGREPGQWGREPENDWTPGNMPTAHDIPNILGALLPIAIAGVLGGGGLGMIAAYAGYQNARNKAQTEAAKEAKTQWQDQLKETTARLKDEMIGAQGILADFGKDQTSPAAQEAWRRLAMNFDDKQLMAALDSQDMGKVEDLFKRRDSVFQTLSKTSDAQARADAEQAKKDEEARQQAAPFEQGAPTAGAERGAQPTAPTTGVDWSMGGAPAPIIAPPGQGGPAAGAAPPGGAPPAVPAAAPAPSEQPPAPEEPQPPDGAPQPPAGAPQAPGAVPAAAPAPSPAPYGPEVESKAVGFVMGDTDLTGIGKIQQAQIQGRAAQLQNQLNAIPKNLQGQDLVRAVSAINPQMGSTLANLLAYRQGVPQAGETSGGQAGRMLPFWSRMIDLASQADHTWNPDNYDMYRKAREQFTPGGSMGTTLQRSNKLLASTAAVLQATNEVEKKLASGQGSPSELEAAITAFVTKGIVGTGEYAGLMAALRTFAIESTAVSEGGHPTVTLTEMIANAIPVSRTPADIRNFVKYDLLSSISAIENAHTTWKQLPNNQTTEPLGYREDVFQGLTAVANTLDPQTGHIEGENLPSILRAVIPPPRAPAPAPGPGQGGGPTTGGSGWTITPVH